MTPSTYNQAKQHLLFVVSLLAPTGSDQRKAVEIIREMEMEHEDPKAVLIRLISYLADGLFYNNWPSELDKR